MARSEAALDSAFGELLGARSPEPAAGECKARAAKAFENYRQVQRRRDIKHHRTDSHHNAANNRFVVALSARRVMEQDPDELLSGCDCTEEAVLVLAAVLRTLQFFAGGEARHHYRVDLVAAAQVHIPDFDARALGIRYFADSEVGRDVGDEATTMLLAAGDPSSVHALAHLRVDDAWMSWVDQLIVDGTSSVTDPRVRHVLAHRLMLDNELDQQQFERVVSRHFVAPESAGSLNSLIRDLVPLALVHEERWGAEDQADSLWAAAATMADRLPFGSEWLLTEACRVLAYRKVGRTDRCIAIIDALEQAGLWSAEEPGWRDGVNCIRSIVYMTPTVADLSSGLGGSRDQHESIGRSRS